MKTDTETYYDFLIESYVPAVELDQITNPEGCLHEPLLDRRALPHEVLDECFIWDNTPQGHGYWSDVYYSLRRMHYERSVD